MNIIMVAIVSGSLIIGGIILTVVVSNMLKREGSFELVQGKLENSDSAIADAMPYLKITNEWSK